MDKVYGLLINYQSFFVSRVTHWMMTVTRIEVNSTMELMDIYNSRTGNVS